MRTVVSPSRMYQDSTPGWLCSVPTSLGSRVCSDNCSRYSVETGAGTGPISLISVPPADLPPAGPRVNSQPRPLASTDIAAGFSTARAACSVGNVSTCQYSGPAGSSVSRFWMGPAMVVMPTAPPASPATAGPGAGAGVGRGVGNTSGGGGCARRLMAIPAPAAPSPATSVPAPNNRMRRFGIGVSGWPIVSPAGHHSRRLPPPEGDCRVERFR